jgi:transposase
MVRRSSKLSKSTQEKLIEHFIAGTTARTAGELAGVNRHTATLYFHKLREVIAAQMGAWQKMDGEIEVDESYFGGHCKGKRGRGAAGKVAVFGLLKGGGKVYAVMIPDAKQTTLLPIIRQKVVPDSIVYTDCLKSYDVLDVSEFRHERVNHSEEYVAKNGNHINGIENFWSQAKRHLRRYNGIPKQYFHLYLKECEFHFNYGPPALRCQTLKKWVLL